MGEVLLLVVLTVHHAGDVPSAGGLIQVYLWAERVRGFIIDHIHLVLVASSLMLGYITMIGQLSLDPVCSGVCLAEVCWLPNRLAGPP